MPMTERNLQSALEFALRQWKAYAELEDERRLGEGDTAEDSLYRTFKSILDDYTDGAARAAPKVGLDETTSGELVRGIGSLPRPNGGDSEFDRIRSLLVRYAARLQDKNEEPPGPHLVAFAMLQAVDLLDVLMGRSLSMLGALKKLTQFGPSAPAWEIAIAAIAKAEGRQ